MKPENVLKGRMAESLMEQILKKGGNQVYRFGYESVLQNLTQLDIIFNRYNDIGEQVRSMPDFLIIESRNSRPFFIEVKFRVVPKWHKDDLKMLKRIEKFWKAKVIMINCTEKPYFRVSYPPYMEEGKPILKPLSEDGDLHIEEPLLENFGKLVEKYLIHFASND